MWILTSIRSVHLACTTLDIKDTVFKKATCLLHRLSGCVEILLQAHSQWRFGIPKQGWLLKGRGLRVPRAKWCVFLGIWYQIIIRSESGSAGPPWRPLWSSVVLSWHRSSHTSFAVFCRLDTMWVVCNAWCTAGFWRNYLCVISLWPSLPFHPWLVLISVLAKVNSRWGRSVSQAASPRASPRSSASERPRVLSVPVTFTLSADATVPSGVS